MRLTVSLLILFSLIARSEGASRVRAGLQVLYDFSDAKGAVVKDQSGFGSPLNLRIADLKAVRRRQGTLQMMGDTIIKSEGSAKKISAAVKQSGAITVEAWIKPANLTQAGPARIVTISRDSNERNVTLGQDGDKYQVRFRTRKTNNNGIPETATDGKAVKRKLTHVLYTRDRSGRTRIYLDGKQVKQRYVSDPTSNWNSKFALALGNEMNGSRPWKGTYHLVAIYSRALSIKEIGQNFRAGAGGATKQLVKKPKQSPGEILFETKIAAILSEHCLECHDSATHKGKLDLSRKKTAIFEGIIVPGSSAKSLVWETVESDEMPDNRPPLSAEEKKLLRQWIDGGAQWTGEVIDPAIYAHKRAAKTRFVQRLTISEYIETVRATMGVDITKEARKILPPDLRADGFSNTAYNLGIDFKHVGSYSKLAELIVNRLDVIKFASRFNRSRKLIDKDNRALIEAMGKWILRGPLEDHETVAYRGIATTAVASGVNFEGAMGFILEAMLQAPRFIYRMEKQHGDGETHPVGEYELASRLSYIIWGGPPDSKLMSAAESGELSDEEGVAGQVKRLLADPRAIKRSQQFLSEWLNLGRLANMQPNAKKYPTWSRQLGEDMRRETLAFFKDVAWEQNRPLHDLLNAQSTWVTPALAAHYDLPYQGKGLGRVDVAKTPSRGGLLTQGSILTIGGDEASMVARGLFVLHDLLRGAVKDPPPCVDVTPIPTKSGLTQRGIAEQRIANVNCGGCHIRFEPLAFGLEKFDGIGASHERDEHGNKLREDGGILFPGTAKTISYQTSSELMNLLAGSERVRECLTWKVTQFALGRPLNAIDAPVVASIHRTSQKNGGTYASLVAAIATSELVQMTRTEMAAVNNN
jgi:hypothetical protein